MLNKNIKISIIISATFFVYLIGSVIYFSYLKSTLIFQQTQLARLLRVTSSNDAEKFSYDDYSSMPNDQVNNRISELIEEIETMREEIEMQREEIKTQKEKQNNEVIFEIVRNAIDPDTNLKYSEYIQRRLNTINQQYNWALEKQTNNMYFISLASSNGVGLFWEVNSGTRTVKLINGNYLLEKKYGINSTSIDNTFNIENISLEEVYLRSKKMILFFSSDGIEYKISGSIKNNSGENITDCNLGIEFVTVYSNNKIFKLSANDITFERPTLSKPWLPNRVRNFTITTEYINVEYKNYDPNEAVVKIFINAEDAMGHKYNGAFPERNIKKTIRKIKLTS